MKKLIIGLSIVFTLNVHAGTTIIESQATENGIKKCASQLKLIGDFIIEGKAHATHSSWNSTDADNHLYASLTSKAYSDGDSHVTVIASPTTSGGCDSTYVETFALAKSCMLSREEIYKDWTYDGTMNGKTLVLKNKSGNVTVYLTPQGTNDNICLVSKREVIYQ